MRLFLQISLLWSIAALNATAQFHPQAPLNGHHAIHKDDAQIKAWATEATFEPGWLQATDTSMGKVGTNNINNILGKANNNIISLGDGGSATFTFEQPIQNGSGPDFLVFENGFHKIDDSTFAYLELAFVEVSSNGTDFVRFPATSYINDSLQNDNFAYTDARLINNLAGKYVKDWGTPFDLEELKGAPNLDVNNITHIRVVDVVGILDESLGSKDINDRLINDPFPTPYLSSGFDLNALGVIHQVQHPNSIAQLASVFKVYPNPVQATLFVESDIQLNNAQVLLIDMWGITHISQAFENGSIDIGHLPKGNYILRIQNSMYVYQTQISKL